MSIEALRQAHLQLSNYHLHSKPELPLRTASTLLEYVIFDELLRNYIILIFKIKIISLKIFFYLFTQNAVNINLKLFGSIISTTYKA